MCRLVAYQVMGISLLPQPIDCFDNRNAFLLQKSVVYYTILIFLAHVVVLTLDFVAFFFEMVFGNIWWLFGAAARRECCDGAKFSRTVVCEMFIDDGVFEFGLLLGFIITIHKFSLFNLL